MKIIQISASYKPAVVYGGPTQSVSKLSEQLCENGVQTEVFTTLANGKNELSFPAGSLITIDGVRVRFFRRLTKDHSHFSPALLQHLWLAINQTKEPLIIHIHAWWNLVSMLSCIVAQLKKVPIVLSPRGTLSDYSFSNNHTSFKKWMHLLAGKKLLSKCFFHVTSEQEKQEIISLIHPEKIKIIPNFISLSQNFTLQTPQQTGILKLIFLSRIEAKKGLEILLEALSKVDFPYHLTIAGSGEAVYIDSLKKIANKRSMTNRISWIGFQDQEQKFRVLQEHDLLILPSHNENFANVVVESLAVGTAVLISNKVGLADYVKQNNLGWIFENQPEKLREELVKISNNRNLLEEIRSTSPKQIERDFADEKLVKEYVDYYQEILNG